MTGQWQVEAVWKGLLHFESLQRYYTFVGGRLASRGRCLRLAVLTVSSGVAVALLAGLPLGVARALAVLAAALAIWSELADYSRKSARSLDIASNLGLVAVEMRALWFGLDDLAAEEAERAWRELNERATAVTRHVPADLLGHRSLQDRAEDETYGYWAGTESARVVGAEA